MTSFNNIDPSLHDLSHDLSFLGDPITNPATSQDGHHDTNGNSIPGGEPVHHPAFVLLTIDVISFPAGFMLPPDAMQVDVPLAPPGTKFMCELVSHSLEICDYLWTDV
jgi:hypothetical protein